MEYIILGLSISITILIILYIVQMSNTQTERRRYHEYVTGHATELDNKERQHQEALRSQFHQYQIDKEAQQRDFNNQLTEKDKVYSKLFSLHKSQQVRMGHIMEKIAPMLDTFPVDVTDASVLPLFDAVDYLVIKIGSKDPHQDGIYFVEIKTGKADLSHKQRAVRNLIRDGRVHFLTFRADKNMENDDDKEEAGREV
jgi:predicted Holliday junction resolvase-like endonuclease